jgi:hypothetical protein
VFESKAMVKNEPSFANIDFEMVGTAGSVILLITFRVKLFRLLPYTIEYSFADASDNDI